MSAEVDHLSEKMHNAAGPINDSIRPDPPLPSLHGCSGLASRSAASEPAQGVAEMERQVQLLAAQKANLERELQEERARRQAAEQEHAALLVVTRFAKELDSPPDAEQAARAMLPVIARLAPCDLAAIYQLQPGEGGVKPRMKLLAATDAYARLLPRALPLNHPLIARAMADLQPCSITDGHFPPFALNGQSFPAMIALPVTFHGGLRGLILLADSDPGQFSNPCPALESVVETLAGVWEFSRQNDALMDLVSAIARLSYVQETGSLLERIATIARQTLRARFTVAAIHTPQGWILRASGEAPLLSESLLHGAGSFLADALRTPNTVRLADLRAEPRAAGLKLDSPELCTALFTVIRGGSNGLPVEGLLLTFGKQNERAFTGEDVRMAELLATRAAINLESAFLNQQLQENLTNIQRLYTLSQQIANVKDLHRAAWAIVRTAHRLTKARRCGMVVYSLDGQERKADIHLPSRASGQAQPEEMIARAMQNRRTISQPSANGWTIVVIPIQSRHLTYGALWMEMPERAARAEPGEELGALVNEAAQTVERMFLLDETREQARTLERTNRQLADALRELEQSYDQTIQALMHALDARDRETEDHSWRVTELSVWLGKQMGLTTEDLRGLRRGAMLHDLGKIGIRDHVLRKASRLDEDEWTEMRKHPENGVEIIRDIAPLSDAIPVIIGHQERWDGSGYPRGLLGKEIPLLARIFAVIDVYDALTSRRVYREPQTKEEALAYLDQQAGVHFDPEIVALFTRLMRTAPPPFEV